MKPKVALLARAVVVLMERWPVAASELPKGKDEASRKISGGRMLSGPNESGEVASSVLSGLS
jgi:hypothetical protein